MPFSPAKQAGGAGSSRVPHGTANPLARFEDDNAPTGAGPEQAELVRGRYMRDMVRQREQERGSEHRVELAEGAERSARYREGYELDQGDGSGAPSESDDGDVERGETESLRRSRTGGSKEAAGGKGHVGGGGGDEEGKEGEPDSLEAEAANAMQLIPDEVTTHALSHSIKRDIIKTRRYRVFPFYLGFLLVFSLSVGLEHLDTDDRFYMTSAIRDLVDQSTFNDVSTSDAWYDWASLMVTRVWGQQDVAKAVTPLDRNVPLGFMLIRQWRVKPSYCNRSPQINVLSTESLARLPSLCYGGYSAGSLDVSAYGPGMAWKTVRNLNYSVKATDIEGRLNTYAALSDAFPVYMYLNASLGSVNSQLQVMKKSRFIDSSSRAVVVDLLFYNPNIERFQLYHLITELDSTGDLVVSTKSTIFRFLKYSESSFYGFLFFLDIIIFICAILFVVDLWLTVKNHYALYDKLYDSVNFWELYMTAMVVLLLIRCVLRFWMWTRGEEIGGSFNLDASEYGGDDDKKMFQAACEYIEKHKIALSMDAWVAMLAWLRVFEFLQFNERLNLVTETVVRSVGQLASMLIIFCIILIGFSMAGRIFYGHALYEFRTFLAAAGYLVRLVFSADLGDYLEMEAIRPIMTPLYVPFFFILTWLVLLNMVLAIIAGSFAALQERATKAKTWGLADLWGDMLKASQRITPFTLRKLWHKHTNEPGKPGSEEPEDRVRMRLELLPRLQRLERDEKAATGEAEVFVTKTRFKEETEGLMRPMTADRIFVKAATDIAGADERTFKLGERFAFHLNKRLLEIEGRIKGQQPHIERIPEIEKASVRQHIMNLQPKVDRLTELQDDIRRELFNIHHNLPVHFQEVHADFAKQMETLESITMQRVAPQLQNLVNSVQHPPGDDPRRSQR
eukprot:Rhum_TRINITY_DN2098_c0_g1::Rhum_TRINITY_DN2098_c0_g1_i1::g.5792::m.5792/K04986/PKD2; polycystin 2